MVMMDTAAELMIRNNAAGRAGHEQLWTLLTDEGRTVRQDVTAAGKR